MKNLFKKYQKPLLKLANNRFGRKLIGIRTDVNKNKKIVKLTPNASIWDIGNNKLQGHFYSGKDIFAEKLWYALTCLDTLSTVPKYLKQEYQDLRALAYYLGLTKNNFSYPLIAFTANDYNCGVGSGFCRTAFGAWNTNHDATSADSHYQQTSNYIAVSRSAVDGTFLITRVFLPTNTSGIGAGSTVTACTLDLYVITEIVDDNIGSYRYTTVIGATTQANSASLENNDYNNCGAVDNPTKWSADLALASMTLNQYNSWTFNSTGKSAIEVTGTTLLGLRNGFDIVDASPTSDGNSRFYFNFSEAVSNKPHLTITYTPSSGFLVFM